jgi:hypothetical protein
MMALKGLFLSIFSLFGSANQPYHSKKHPFHVATTEVVYQPKTRHLEITAKFFVDDFELALRKNQPKLKLEAEILAKHYPAIEAYVQQHLKLSDGQKPMVYKLLGCEIERESCLVYLETQTVALPKKLDIRCDFLYQIYKDQMNIFHLNLGAQKESFRLNYPDYKR